MLATFSPGELPGARPVRYHETDVGSFQSLWEGAKGVDGECVGRGGGPMSGWRVDGEGFFFYFLLLDFFSFFGFFDFFLALFFFRGMVKVTAELPLMER